MARWGYERGFTIIHDPTVKKKVSCKDCTYYDKSDCSCMKRPLFLPEDGYSMWMSCRYFDLSSQAHRYDEKYEYIEARKKRIRQDTVDTVDKLKKPAKPKRTRVEDYRKIGKSIYMVPLSLLSGSRELEHYTFSPDKIRDIKECYNTNGMFDKPIIVKPDGEKYQVAIISSVSS